MTPQDDETLWRNRFILVQLVRIGGTVVVLAALLLWRSDVIVQGGSIVGLPIALAGLVIAFWGPRYISRNWRTPPAP